METSEKPKIESTEATVRCLRYGQVIAQEKKAIPRLQKLLNEANKLKRKSYITMKYRHR